MSDDGSTVVEKKGRGRPKSNGTQSVSFFLILTNFLNFFIFYLLLFTFKIYREFLLQSAPQKPQLVLPGTEFINYNLY